MSNTNGTNAAMCDLAAAINPSSRGKTGWICVGGIPTTNVCTWGGITCSSGSVTVISLQTLSLTGSLPTSIGSLVKLKNIDICCNSIGGTIPSSIGFLTAISDLSIGANKFVGTIPSTIGYMSSLTDMFFDTNHFTGKVPSTLGYLTNLRYLQIGQASGINSLTGSLPTALCSIGLTRLDMENTYLTCYPSCLYSLSTLNFGTIPVCGQGMSI